MLIDMVGYLNTELLIKSKVAQKLLQNLNVAFQPKDHFSLFLDF